MHVISYISNSTAAPDLVEREIEDIVKVSQSRNAKMGITGVLFCANNYFFQTIEGNEPELRRVYESIESDPRHKNINKLIDEKVEERFFTDWMLDTYYVDNPELINPTTIQLLQALYVQNFGVNSGDLIEFVKKMIDEMDTFKILHTPYIK